MLIFDMLEIYKINYIVTDINLVMIEYYFTLYMYILLFDSQKYAYHNSTKFDYYEMFIICYTPISLYL